MNIQHINKARRGHVYPVLCQMTYGHRKTLCLIKKRAPEYTHATPIVRSRLTYAQSGFDIDEWNRNHAHSSSYHWIITGEHGWQIIPNDNEDALKSLPNIDSYV